MARGTFSSGTLNAPIPEYKGFTDPNARVFTNSATFRRDYKSYPMTKRRAAPPPACGARRASRSRRGQRGADPALPGGARGMPTSELAVLKAVGERGT